jgi:hypothetical protein
MKTKSVKILITGLLLVIPMFVFGLGVFNPINVSASPASDLQKGANQAQDTTVNGTPTTLFGTDSAFTAIINTALFIVGAVSVLMLIYGGIRYTTSGGGVSSASGSEVKSVATAKNIILYSIVGIIVSIAAYAIVNWVTGQFLASSVPPTTTATTTTLPDTDLTAADTEIAVTDNTVPDYVSPKGVAVLTYGVVNAMTELFANEPAPEVLLPSYGPATDGEPTPEPKSDTNLAEQTLTSDEETVAINETSTLITELSAETNSENAEGKTGDGMQKIRNTGMLVIAKEEIVNDKWGENIGKDSGTRIIDYQNYTGGGDGSAWCASFVSFAHKKATGLNNIRHYGVSQMIDQAGSKAKKYNKENGLPHPGDILAWNKYDLTEGHTGIFIKFVTTGPQKGMWLTVEGNGHGKLKNGKVQYYYKSPDYWKATNVSSAQAYFIRP